MPAKLLEYPTEGSTVDTDGDGITDVDELESIIPVEECDFGDGSRKTLGNLGTDLLFMSEYKMNQNFFAFNYPNKDMTRKNAEKLRDYLNNLATCYPMDIDLNPNNAILGGTYKTYSSLNPFVKDKLEYINSNQTDPLKYSNHGNTKYYFLAGYDVTASVDVPISHLNKNMDFDINMMSYGNFSEYKNNIKNSFISNTSYSDLAYDKNFSRVFNLKSSDGDNVVNNQSQLGLKFEGDKDSSALLKSIKAEKMWMNIDTYLGHNMAFHFHGQNQHRNETIDRAIDYLLE